jgi:hypothetical protein
MRKKGVSVKIFEGRRQKVTRLFTKYILKPFLRGSG